MTAETPAEYAFVGYRVQVSPVAPISAHFCVLSLEATQHAGLRWAGAALSMP